MARKTVYIPDDLLKMLEASDTDIGQSLSREFQNYLRNRLHDARSESWFRDLSSGVTLRPLTEADIAGVLEIWGENDDGWNLTEMSRRRIADNLRRTVDHPDAFCIVAEEESQIVGFVTASINGHPVMPGRSGEIEEVHVLSGYRRRKIGSDLVKSAVKWLKNAGIDHIRLLYPVEDEKILKRFYQGLGFDCDMVVANIWPR